jgi:molybdopterin synthase catalytic subunit
LGVRVKVLFFGQLKDIAGRSEDTLELPPIAVLEDVFEYYATRLPRLRELRNSTVLARNHQFLPASTQLQDGDEVALLPPVSGGSGAMLHEIEDQAGHYFALTREPIDTTPLRRRVLEGSDGALIEFAGVVRNNTKGRATHYLEYECYEAMAIQVMASIGRQIAAEHEIGRIAMVHRLGRMQISEASVVILVAAPHRKPAFAAALEGINRLKRLVPIWKKEYFADGEVWVEGEWDDSVLQR